MSGQGQAKRRPRQRQPPGLPSFPNEGARAWPHLLHSAHVVCRGKQSRIQRRHRRRHLLPGRAQASLRHGREGSNEGRAGR